MSRASSRPSPVEVLLEDLQRDDAARHDLVMRVRALVLSVDPSITEAARYGGLLFTGASPFCGVFSYPRHVALEFSRGADLADPHHVLEGEGAKRRHIKLVVRGDLFAKNVRDYVERAFQAVPARPVRAVRRPGLRRA